MTNIIVNNAANAVNLNDAIAHADALFTAWEQATDAQHAAWEASIAANYSAASIAAVSAALEAVNVAHAAWKAAEAVVRTATAADEAAYDAMLCAQYDALDYDYTDYRPGSTTEPIPYTITEAGYTYLDHHYHTTLADGGESPYGDGTTGWAQPSPVPSYYQSTPDLDARDRLEKLAY